MQKITTTHTRRSIPQRIAKGIGIFLLSILGLIVLILILIQTGPVQNFGRKKIVSFLQNKLKTRVEIKHLDIDFPKMLVLEGVYIEDRTKDTLIAGNRLKVDIDMFKLLKSEVLIKEINLDGITAKVKRQLPDTTFNFQFIVDAFASGEKKENTDTSAMKMAIDKIIVDKTRMVYYDVVTGNDVDVYLGHFDTRINTFDPTNLRYDVPSIVLSGVRGRVNQIKPMEVTAVKTNPNPTVKNEAPKFLNFTNAETAFRDIDISYSNAVSAMSTRIAFKDLVVHPETFDLKNSNIAVKDIELNNLDGYFRMGKAEGAEVVKLTTETGKEVATEAMPWKFTVGAIRLNNNNFSFDDNTKPRIGRGMDYSHLGLADLTLHADNFLMHNDTIALDVTEGRMRERSGFVLTKLQTDVVYTNQGATLKNLLIQTPGSEIKRGLTIRYPSLAAIQKAPGLMEMNIDIDNSYIQNKDILTFVPALAAQPAFRNPSARIFVNSKVRGSMNRLVIDQFQFRGLNNTSIDVTGVVNNAMDPNNVGVDLTIRKFNTSRADIVSISPPGAIPNNITIPEAIALSGTIKGGMKDATADLALNTSLGSARVNGRIINAADKIDAAYNAAISANNLNVGAITKQPQNVGLITASFKITGTGYDPERANARVIGVVQSAVVKKYNYRNLRLDASLAKQKFAAKASIRDPNINLAINARGNMGGNLPGFVVDADIDSIKTLPLHLTPNPIYYRGKITANVPELNLDALNGDINVVNSVLVMNNQRIAMDSLTAVARYQNGQQLIDLKTDFVDARINGKYKLAQLGDIFIETIQPYYAINTGKPKNVDPFDFTLDATVTDHPTLHAFVPDLKRFDGMRLNSAFSSADGLNAKMIMPYTVYGTNTIDSVSLNAATAGNALNITTFINGVKAGTSLSLYNTSLRATLANNKVDFGLLLKDKAAKDKYRIAGMLSQEPNNVLAISLKPDSLLLNYDPWSVNNDNLIRFGPTVVNARNFNLSKGDQHLIINSVGDAGNSPLRVEFSRFQIATLSGFVQNDSLPVDGNLNGNIMVRDVLKQPNFVTDLTLNNLSFKRDTVGDVNIKVNNNRQNIFETNVTITGRGNDIALTGNYYLKPANASSFDMTLDIRTLPFKTIEALSMGSLVNTSGNLSGRVGITGTAQKPNVDGSIAFNRTAFTPAMLGTEFRIDNDAIKVNNSGIRFDTFTILDSAGNKLVVDGLAGTQNFVNYNLDLSVKARNFRAINTTKRQNALYYGKLYFNTNMRIKGTETAPKIDGSFRVNENTNLSIVIPQGEPGIVDRKGVIEFVDMDAPANDSIFKHVVATYDSTFNKSAVTGMDVAMNIEVVKEAVFNVIIDEGNGDFLKLQGQANLNAGIDPSGKINMTGTYEIASGGYELSFNFIRRSFSIQQGSKITWTGEPTTADIDVTAVYIANTSALDLVGNQVEQEVRARMQQKLPFNVKLNVRGQLMQPSLTFDIDLPKENTARVASDILTLVNTRLEQLKTEPSELNKQVFALLLLNRFVGENPFESSGGGGGFSAASYAKQSVSKILTQQLNNLAGDLIAGVDISFDVNTDEDYSTGERRDRTDFNVNLSKRLLSDRLKVSVGTNYELEGPQKSRQTGSNVIGNVTVDYQLTQDGRYLIRGYRRNNYDAVVEGQVVETGLRFVISMDYNKFRELFMRKRRGKKNENKDDKNADTNKATTSNKPTEKNTDTTSIVFTDKIVADNRKNDAATVNDSTDEK